MLEGLEQLERIEMQMSTMRASSLPLIFVLFSLSRRACASSWSSRVQEIIYFGL